MAAHYQWHCVSPHAAFPPRDGAGALVYQDRMWLIGGWNPHDKAAYPRICVNDVWSSSDGAQWTLVKPNTFKDQTFDPEVDWEGRHTAGHVVFQDKMWIVGGDVNQGHYHFDVWNSNNGRTWRRIDKRVPWGPRALQHTLTFKDRIWVMGGQTLPQFESVPGEYVVYNDIWNSPDGRAWEKVQTRGRIWSPRGMIGGNVVFKDRMWILGGGIYETANTEDEKGDWQVLNDVWSSEDGVTWHRHLEKAPWKPRIYHNVAVFDGRMWLMEGFGPGNMNDVWHSTDGEHWQELPQTPWAPRHAGSLFVYDDALWVVAGNNMESDVWRLQRT